MEEVNPTAPADKSEELLNKLPPAKQARLSTVLNGVGNGLLVGTLPVVAYEGYQRFKNPTTPRPIVGAAIAFATASAAVGCWYGFKEARQVENYRRSIGDEIESLHQQNSTNQSKIAELTAAVQAKEEAKVASR